jgi:hypothetical protein
MYMNFYTQRGVQYDINWERYAYLENTRLDLVVNPC